jgi:hypothetical protein
MALDPGFRPPLFYALSCPVGQEALPAGGAGPQMTSQGAHKAYLEALRRMTPEQRLLKALELSRLVRDLHLHGLRRRFPQHSKTQIREIFLGSLKRCWNRNY